MRVQGEQIFEILIPHQDDLVSSYFLFLYFEKDIKIFAVGFVLIITFSYIAIPQRKILESFFRLEEGAIDGGTVGQFLEEPSRDLLLAHCSLNGLLEKDCWVLGNDAFQWFQQFSSIYIQNHLLCWCLFSKLLHTLIHNCTVHFELANPYIPLKLQCSHPISEKCTRQHSQLLVAVSIIVKHIVKVFTIISPKDYQRRTAKCCTMSSSRNWNLFFFVINLFKSAILRVNYYKIVQVTAESTTKNIQFTLKLVT